MINENTKVIPIPGKELLVIPEGFTLSEYTHETINIVKDFFAKNNYIVDIDNICDIEWMNEQKPDFSVTEVPNKCKIAAINLKSSCVQNVINMLNYKLPESDSESFYNDITNDTTLTAYFYINDEKVRIELPYCTIKNIVDMMNK